MDAPITLFARIQSHFAAGGGVQVRTYLRATNYTPKHAAMFREAVNGVQVQRGRQWDHVFPQYVFFSKNYPFAGK